MPLGRETKQESECIISFLYHSKVKVTPKCGRAVAFSSGGENLHGVLPVKEGTRCALGMWFTLDPKHKEGAREVADQILKSFSDHNRASEPEVHDGLPNND